ncbi:dual serine/threonine and tyrosine protein kinase-like [Tubulanus polymorphus]|uniref:dual serine/threonine and tyrosine protein kinase-like n=1 Tax=Tubulanus polymorphus TaxID=672921 RepID=UPI003DA203F0
MAGFQRGQSISSSEDTLEKGYEEIKSTFTFFRENGRKLEKLCRDTKCIYEEIEKDLRGVSFRKSLSNYLLLEGEEKKVEQLKHNPSLIFVGQTKAGKSSLINELLGKSLVTSDQRPCTARLVRLTYGDVAFPKITILNPDSSVHTPAEQIKTSHVPTEFVNLPFEERDNETTVQTSVQVEVKHQLLEAGVDIIDSPGRNENKTLDNLVTQQMDSILPLVMYVIDGRNCLTSSDIQDIQAIIEKTSSCENVFFIVNKIDPQPKRGTSSSDETDSDETDDDSESEDDIIKREQGIKAKIFNKLVRAKFINKKYENKMDDCPNFHALSSWEVKTYRRTYQKNPAMAEKTRYVDHFYRFQKCLNDYIKEQLDRKIKTAIDGILMSHCRCLDFFILTANDISKTQRSVEKDMLDFAKQEQSLYRNAAKMIDQQASDFNKLLVERMALKNNDIISAVGQYEYQEEELKVTITRDKRIKDSEFVDRCKRKIVEVTQRYLSEEITSLLVEKFNQGDMLLSELASRVEALGSDEGYQGAARVLRKTLIECYQFDLVGREFKKNIFQKAWSAVVRFFSSIASLFSGSVAVGEPRWKESVASATLSEVDHAQLTKFVLEGVKEHVTFGHSKFEDEMANLQQIHESNCAMGEAERKKLTNQAPTVAQLQLDAFDLNDRFTYNNIVLLETIGKGAQGVVYGTTVKGPDGEDCAVKVIKYQSNQDLGDLALEIHYTRQFKHENIMPLYASVLMPRTSELYLLSPHMDGDLMQMIPGIKSLRERLGIAHQTANALSYLHSRDMSHRDIKSSNILIAKRSKGYKAIITDFGLMKPVGLQQHSFVGTPIHIAPEIIQGEHYDTSVDIFSFGILLWYICEGNGNRHPEYADYCQGVGPILIVSALGKRPERKDYFTEDCWRLMTKCWDHNPVARPKADDVVTELKMIRAKPLPS